MRRGSVIPAKTHRPARASRAGLLLFLALIARAGPAPAARAETAVYYGSADRLSEAGRLADSTVALFRAQDVAVDRASGRARLAATPLGERFGLCPDEPYVAEPSGAFCSGALVGEDLVLTAAHCLRHSPCASTRFVFGFVSPSLELAAADVYSCAAVVASRYESGSDDWAIVRLDRPVAGRAPLPVERSGDARNGTPLLMIGYPSGLPAKASTGATVFDASPEAYFVSDLDNFAGSSGSPVLDARRGTIVGVLIYDPMSVDYVPRGGCNAHVRCPSPSCVGARATKASRFAEWVP